MATVDYPGNNMTSIVDLIDYVNNITGGIGLFGIGMLIIIFFVSFLSTKAYTFSRAFGFASFLTMISGIFLRFLGLINDAVFFITVVLFVISLIFLIGEDRYAQT